MMYTLYYTLEVSDTAQIQGISLIISGKLVKGNIAPYKFYSVHCTNETKFNQCMDE